MTLEAQIGAMTVPQEFVRLANALLTAEYGDHFLAIDDTQADRGNDGYLKSEKRLFAMHCFKRVQNQGLLDEIRRKAIGDLGKAAALKAEGLWEIERWTFVSNYPMPEAVGKTLIARGAADGIDVSWWGEDRLAVLLQTHGELLPRFPALQVNRVETTLEHLGKQVSALAPDDSPFNGVPSTSNEIDRLLAHRPGGWEYLLFAGCLSQQRDALDRKWHDYRLGISSTTPHRIDDASEISSFLGPYMSRLSQQIEILDRLNTPESQEAAFGKPGDAGDPSAIQYYAARLVSVYEDMLDWASDIRAVDPADEFKRLFALASRFVEKPISEIRTVIEQAQNAAEAIPAYLAQDDGDEVAPMVVELTLTLGFPPGLADEFSAETEAVRRRLG